MDWADLTIAALGTVASMAAVYLAWRALPPGRRFRRRRRPVGDPPVDLPPGGHYDAFISYAKKDVAAATELATRLCADSLSVFLAEWVGEGLVVLLEKEKAILGSANGVLLFSEASMADLAILDDYAALLQRVHEGGRRFIPVLIEDVELPPFAKIRQPLDLRAATGDAYDEKIVRLAHALRGRQPDPAS